MLVAKLSIRCDVKDEADATEVETIVATAVAHALTNAGHPGNTTVTFQSFKQDHGVAGPQPAA